MTDTTVNGYSFYMTNSIEEFDEDVAATMIAGISEKVSPEAWKYATRGLSESEKRIVDMMVRVGKKLR